jgi:adenylate cyclase
VPSDRIERRLAAILAADMVGYSRLIEIDEAGTISRQRSHRHDLIDPTIEAHKGRIVKTSGDGMLVEFASAVDAVDCAVHIQQAMDQRESGQPTDTRIQYRIGVNVGDIIIDGDDILGDGVNIAARLEGLAVSGGVAISGYAHEQTRGKLTVEFEDTGDHEVKNLTRPVRVWRWPSVETTIEATESAPTEAPAKSVDSSLKALIDSIQQPTLAVLPFVNMSRNEDLDFFCDGLTENLITDLSRGARMSVAARNSSFGFKDRTVDINDAAAKLGVRYLIEGSVQAMGTRLRVNAQLIDSTTGDHVWADRYDGSTDDLFTAQDELCEAIFIEIDAAICSGEEARKLGAQTENADASKYMQRAVVHFAFQDNQGFIKAQEEADKAYAIDGDFTFASIYRAAARVQQVLHGWAADDSVLLDEAMEICESAIERMQGAKPTTDYGGLYLVRGLIHLTNRAFDQSLRDCNLGIKLVPNIGPARHIYARVLIAAGRFNEGYRESVRAIQLQPYIYPSFLLTLGVSCLLSDRPADAALALQKYREIVPNLAHGVAMLAAAFVANGQRDEARQVMSAVRQLDPTVTIKSLLRSYPMQDPAHEAKLAGYLEKAGLAR